MLWSVVVIVVVVSLLVWVGQFHWLREEEKNNNKKKGGYLTLLGVVCEVVSCGGVVL